MTDPTHHLADALAGRYRIEREVGHGGMSTVYLAHDLRHNRKVAVKILRPDLAASLGPERFLREIELAAGLVHPNIVPLYDSGRAGGTPGAEREFLFYVMPYIEGESLRDRLSREGQLPIPDTIRLLRDVVDALAKSHAQGVVHRDIKPENVMIADRHAMVTDFGVAKGVSEAKAGSGLTTAGVAIGTPAYMSPEQAAGDPNIDHRADIYALGAMAYEMLTGRTPFEADTYQATLAAHVSAKPDPVTRHRENLPPALANLVMRCLEKNPADRWQHADDMLPVLDALAATPSGALTPASPPSAVRRRVVRWGPLLVLVALVAVLAVAWRQRHAALPTAPADESTRSIAVLPFVNTSGNPDDEYFADGMSDELTSALGKVPRLRVAARSSAFIFKGRNVDAREVAKRLNVTTVLEGSVRRAGTRLRVSAQLINAADGLQMWSDTYEREDGDAFQIQDEITQSIVSALQLRLGGLAEAVARAGRTDDPVAHDLYLRGNYYVTRSSETDLHRAIAYFQQAIAQDPDYALAYTGIAFAYGALADTYLPPQEAFPLGKAAAEKALEIDSLVPEAHAILGYARYAMDFDLKGADAELTRAIALDSNAANTFFLYGMFLCGTDRDAEGQAAARRATELDPLSQPLAWGLEACLYYGRHFEDLIALHPNTADIDSTFFYFENWIAAAYRELGRYDDALREYQRSQALVPGEPLFGLAVTFARMGRTDDARTILQHIEARAETRFVPLIVPAIVHAALGETDRAVALLEEAYAMREPDFLRAPRYPELDDVTSDPRIRRLLEKIGLE